MVKTAKMRPNLLKLLFKRVRVLSNTKGLVSALTALLTVHFTQNQRLHGVEFPFRRQVELFHSILVDLNGEKYFLNSFQGKKKHLFFPLLFNCSIYKFKTEKENFEEAYIERWNFSGWHTHKKAIKQVFVNL